MRSGGFVAMACVLVLAAPAGAATTRCAHGTVTVKRGGATACVRVPAAGSAARQRAITTRFEAALASVRAPARLRLAARRAERRHASSMLRHHVGSARAAGLGGASGTATETFTTSTGRQATAHVTGTRGADDEFGSVADVETSLDAGAKDGVTTTMKTLQGSGALVKQCPDAAGVLPARAHDALGLAAVARSDDARLGVAYKLTGDIDVTAHVGDDAHLTTYDYRGFVTLEVRATVNGRGKTSTYRVAISAAGVDPRKPVVFEKDEATRFFAGASVYGPHGRIVWGERTSLDTIGMAYMTRAQLLQSANKALLQAEQWFYGSAGCVEAAVSPETQESSPGGSVAMKVVARSTVDGTTIPTGRITVYPDEGTTVSSETGTGELELTAADGGGQWTAERSPINVGFAVISRRGRGVGRGQVTIPGKPAVPFLHVHATLKTEVPCDDARTTFATVDDATIDGDLTARSESNERNSTGSGRATGVSRTVMGDCDHIDSYPHDDATSFSAAYLSDGTVSVSWVVEGNPLRWSYLGWTAPGDGTRTEDWTDGDGTRHHLTVTISNLRASTD